MTQVLTMSPTKCITFEEVLEKNSELKLSDIQILREWCEKQSHLPKIENVQLAKFLHCNYYRIEPTKSTIENYYTLRTHLPEFFSNRDLFKVRQLRDTYKVAAHLHLNNKTKEGYSIMIGRMLDYDFSHFVLNDAIKAGFMVYDEHIWNHDLISGHVYIADAAGVTIGFVGRLNPVSLKKFACYIQEALPARLKAIHVINISPIVDIIYNMIKPMIKKEILDLIHFHATMESLSKYISIESLPNELGGKAGPITELVDAEIKKVENFHEWFLEDEKNNRVNESLRIGKSKTSSDLFGVEGSFKQLDID